MCFDAHWLYRGASNSEVAVFDIARLYADRIIELHVRQSKDDVWTEVLGP
jgi:inosose dehydratase